MESDSNDSSSERERDLHQPSSNEQANPPQQRFAFIGNRIPQTFAAPTLQEFRNFQRNQLFQKAMHHHQKMNEFIQKLNAQFPDVLAQSSHPGVSPAAQSSAMSFQNTAAAIAVDDSTFKRFSEDVTDNPHSTVRDSLTSEALTKHPNQNHVGTATSKSSVSCENSNQASVNAPVAGTAMVDTTAMRSDSPMMETIGFPEHDLLDIDFQKWPDGNVSFCVPPSDLKECGLPVFGWTLKQMSTSPRLDGSIRRIQICLGVFVCPVPGCGFVSKPKTRVNRLQQPVGSAHKCNVHKG